MIYQRDEDYLQFNSSLLCEGRLIDYNIYYKKGNEYVLAFSNGTLSTSIINRLERLNLIYNGLFVDNVNNRYSKSLVHNGRQTKQFIREKAVYQNVLNDCKNLIDTAYKKNTVNIDETDNVSSQIKSHVIDSDITHIVQFINNIRTEDKYLFTHSTNVAYLNGVMGKWLKFPDENIQKLVLIGLLHDIGKIMVPKEILNKPGVLTKDEFEIMKLHPIYSFQILVKSGVVDLDTLLAVRGHHEKNNGTGYPDGLGLDRLSIYTRITTISDIYDAMVAKRVYKKANSPFEILDVFSKGRFSNLDTKLVNVFLSNMPKELTGKEVALSSGEIGIIHYINPNDFSHPFVKVGNDIIQTNESFKCLYIC